MKLFKGAETLQTLIHLEQEQPFVNYAVLTDSLQENSEFTIQAEFTNVVKPGTFDITVIGFTNLNNKKVYCIRASVL